METQPRNILVVEDEGIMRESLVDWFTSEGRKVDAAVRDGIIYVTGPDSM